MDTTTIRAAIAELRHWLDTQLDDEHRDNQYLLEETLRRLDDLERLL
jgi:hypothetical protein